MPDTSPEDRLREAYLAGVRRGASDGMEGYPMVADTWLAHHPEMTTPTAPQTQHAAGCCGDPEPHRADVPDTALTVERLAEAMHETAPRNHNLGEGMARAICASVKSHETRAAAILRALNTPTKENAS